MSATLLVLVRWRRPGRPEMVRWVARSSHGAAYELSFEGSEFPAAEARELARQLGGVAVRPTGIR